MWKGLIFVLLLLCAIASMTGYYHIDKEIKAGEKKIAAGELQIQQGEKALASGKKRLAAGKQQLSSGKQKYQTAKAMPLGLVSNLVPEARPFVEMTEHHIAEGGKKIAAGEAQVTSGEKKIRAGEGKLKAGKAALAQGKQKLAQAKEWRSMLAMAAIFFTTLFSLFCIILLIRNFKQRH